MAHESTVEHQNDVLVNGNGYMKEFKPPSITKVIRENGQSPRPVENGRVSMMDRQNSLVKIAEQRNKTVSHQTSVPHLFAETPKVVTHHHDTDDEDTDHSDNS